MPPRRVSLLIERDSTQTWQDGRVEPWFDTHVHLDRYPEAERVATLARAAEAEVRVMAVAVDVDSSKEVVGLIGAATGVAGGVVGVHPKYAMNFRNELADLAFEKGIVGIGECGFDDSVPDWALQAAAFVAQARVAGELDLALVLHIDGAGAWERLLDHEAALEGLRVVRHYFTGDEAQAGWHAERRHFLSFGNPLRRGPRLRSIAASYPAGPAADRNRQLPVAREDDGARGRGEGRGNAGAGWRVGNR